MPDFVLRASALPDLALCLDQLGDCTDAQFFVVALRSVTETLLPR